MNIEHPINTEAQTDTDWWRGAVIYQIYPRSFQDSTGDGIGDLRGIVQRLPYIASLGVDAIWISPFFTSPMKDFGYDVSNYRDVDPVFGTLADFDAVVAAAKRLGIKVMIDLVFSHTSDQHPWFIESRKTEPNQYTDWYVWADAKPDGTPPNNWLSIFGGSAWQWDARRLQYYMHNFLTSQPDLNFHEHAVQDALLEVAEFWLRRGVEGFRLDTINFYFADKELRNNPALLPKERNATTAPRVNPYNHQNHVYSKNRPENLAFLKRLRAVMDPYGAAAVGEVGDSHRGLEILGEYTAGDDLMHMCYAFELLSGERPTARSIKDLFDKVDRVAADGWACWAYSNHDVERQNSRWKQTPESARCFATLMMCLRGSACIYQGEELGLNEADVRFEELQDPYGIEFWPEFKGRDGCRTPMVWEQSNSNAGFSAAEKTWLPVSAHQLNQSVATAESNKKSLLHHYRQAIALRQNHAALRKGSQTDMTVAGNALHFVRSYGGSDFFCAFNLSDRTTTVQLPQGAWQVIDGAQTRNNTIDLEPWQVCIAQKGAQNG